MIFKCPKCKKLTKRDGRQWPYRAIKIGQSLFSFCEEKKVQVTMKRIK